jgi:predicted NACHT family NTPase
MTTAPAGKGAAGKGKQELLEHGEPVLLERELENRRLIIEGEAGSGKTTFVRRIAWALCREGEEKELRLPFQGFPLFIRIRELDAHITATLDRHQTGPTLPTDRMWITHYLASRGWGLDEEFFEEKLRGPENVLLLDGLDEAANATRRADIVRLIADAATANGCRCVVTTRPTEVEKDTALPGFRTIRLAPLDDAAIQAFLWHWCLWLRRGEERDAKAYYPELLGAVSVPGLRLLARNPLMLTALAVVHLQDHHLPEQRAELYERIMQWLALQAERHNREYKKDDVLRWFGYLALQMQQWRGGQKVQIGIATAADRIADRFAAADRPEPRDAALRFLETAQRVSGIVTLRRGDLAFWHKSFQEYLAARALTGFPDRKLWETALRFLYSPEGREVLPLAAGRMAESAPGAPGRFVRPAHTPCPEKRPEETSSRGGGTGQHAVRSCLHQVPPG